MTVKLCLSTKQATTGVINNCGIRQYLKKQLVGVLVDMTDSLIIGSFPSNWFISQITVLHYYFTEGNNFTLCITNIDKLTSCASKDLVSQ